MLRPPIAGVAAGKEYPALSGGAAATTPVRFGGGTPHGASRGLAYRAGGDDRGPGEAVHDPGLPSGT